jgi:hypothetical protein
MTSDFQLSDIIESGIQNTDDDGILQIYCAGDSDTKSKKKFRGVIFEGQNLVYRGFPYTEEIFDLDDIRLNKLDKLRCCWSYEGTILKFFYHVPSNDEYRKKLVETTGQEGKWYCTTHRKLNAFESRWISKLSFGQLFEKALEKYNLDYKNFLELLDKSKRYHFLLVSSQETRIVIKPELQKETIYLVLMTDCFDRPLDLPWNCDPIPVSETVEIENCEHILKIIESINPFEKQGLLFFNGDCLKQYRILNHKYRQFVNVRNNIPNLKFCYVEVRKDPELAKRFLELYPEETENTAFIEKRIDVIAGELYEVYKQRYIHQQIIKVSHERHDILKIIHDQYKNTRKPIKIDDVYRIINSYSKTNKLYKIIFKTDNIVLGKIQ